MKTRLVLLLSLLALQSYSFTSLWAAAVVLPKGVVVNDPNAIALPSLVYCDLNNDGLGVFDLSGVTPMILAAQSGSAGNYTVSYHETASDAMANASALPSLYSNMAPWSQTIYYRVTNTTTSAFATASFQLIVYPRPSATIPVDYHLCDATGQVGYESFNLTTVTSEVLSNTDPATVTVSFFTSQADAQNSVNAIASPTSFTNTVPWNQTVYVQVMVHATGCFNVVPLHLVVDPLPEVVLPNYPTYTLCDATGATGYEVFDLTSRTSQILMGQTGMIVKFYSSLADAQNDTNVIVNPSAYMNTVPYVQTLGIRVTNALTGCFSISSMDIQVVPLPQLVAPSAPFAVCDDNIDGHSVFDLTTLIPGILGGANYIITFHENITDAQNSGTSTISFGSYHNIHAFVQTIYARGEDPMTGCYSIIPVVLNVNSAPIIAAAPAIVVCDQDMNTQNAATTIDLTVQTPSILAVQLLAASNFVVEYYTSQAMANLGTTPIVNPSSYFGTDGQTIWYRVEHIATGCYNVSSFQLEVNIPLALTTPSPLTLCDDDANPNNQTTTFDLTVKDAEISQGVAGYTVTYYPSYMEALSGVPIADPTSYDNVAMAIQTLGVKVTSPDGCNSYTTLDIRVLPVPVINLISNNTLNTVFVDNNDNVVQPLTLDTQVNNNLGIIYQWKEDGIIIPSADGAVYVVNTAAPNGGDRIFTVTVTSISTGCSATSTLVVHQSTEVPSPLGAISQTFYPGETLANLTVAGSNVQWYANATNKNMASVPLLLNTPLVDGTTYYASQTIGGQESIARLPVTVHAVLGVPSLDKMTLTYAPNPVMDDLILESNHAIASVKVYNLLGQKVFEKQFDAHHAVVTMASLPNGTYIVKVYGESADQVLKIVKR